MSITKSLRHTVSNNQSDEPVEELYDKCMSLASNLWWSWVPEIQHLFRDLDPVRWRLLDHNPIALLKEFTPDRLYERANEMVLFTRINQAYRLLLYIKQSVSFLE